MQTEVGVGEGVRVGEGVGVIARVGITEGVAGWLESLGGSTRADCVSVVDGTRVQPTNIASKLAMLIRRFKLPPCVVPDQFITLYSRFKVGVLGMVSL